MKKFAILEQGKSTNEQITKEHKSQFNSEYSNFYRLNWKVNDDPDAFVCMPGICWSEGRSYLYEVIPKNYEYYIFIDDDIRFLVDNPAKKINDILNEYNPITGCFFEPGSWHCNHLTKSDGTRRIVGFDLNNHIFSKEAAEAFFPVTYHGSGKIMWYAQYIMSKLYPEKQHVYCQIPVENWRHEPPEDKGLSYYTPVPKVVETYAKDLIGQDHNFLSWTHSHIISENRKSKNMNIDRSKKLFSMKDYSKIYNTNNANHKNRKSLYG